MNANKGKQGRDKKGRRGDATGTSAAPGNSGAQSVDPQIETVPVDCGESSFDVHPDIAAMIAQIQVERDQAGEARLRALADFKNFQRRSEENEIRAAQSGKVSVVRALIPALDHFDLAMQQDHSHLTAEQLIGGIKLVQQELIRALESVGLEAIRPQVGDEFDAHAHEAMLRQPTDAMPENHIVQVMQVGYRIGGIILRPAKVSVATTPTDAADPKQPEGAHGSAAINDAPTPPSEPVPNGH